MRESTRQLTLATVAFVLAFAMWGQIGALAPMIREELGLSASQISLLVALPVLLGSLGRIPLGILTDRHGGRLVMSILLLLAAVPAIGLAFSQSYPLIIMWSLVLGLLGTSFAVGVTYCSKWFPPAVQGTALGVFGIGNIGQSLAVFAAPALAVMLGSWHHVPLIFGAACVIWGLVFLAAARDAAPPEPRASRPIGEILRRTPMVWMLCAFYFVTFGGFIALSIYLPTLLTDRYALTLADAGLRTSIFVALATLSRPVGGWLADRYGGSSVLAAVFAVVAVDAALLIPESIFTFTAGALSFALVAGIGNGAVFKLVPEHFPDETGAATGLVGAFGGLGGFFPPILLGVLMEWTGSYTLGFCGLSLTAMACLAVVRQLQRRTTFQALGLQRPAEP